MTGTTLDRLARANPGLAVFGTEDARLAQYGRMVEVPGLDALLAAADPRIPSDLEANAYVASDPELEAHPAAARFGPVFGFSALQVGWNAGPNTRLNGLEWHKTPEILAAVTDLALLLGRVEDVDWDAARWALPIARTWWSAYSCRPERPSSSIRARCTWRPAGLRERASRAW